MRERPSIPEEDLRTVLLEEYEIRAVGLDFLPLGHDSNAGVYRVVGERGESYLLKTKRGTFYEASCRIPRHLRDQGITSVIAPLSTTRDALWVRVGEWTLILYPFFEGDTGMRQGMSDESWRDVGTTLRRIHGAPLPPEAIFQSLRIERFDPAEYRRWVHRFEEQQLRGEGGSMFERALRASWMAHQPTIHALLDCMEDLGSVLRLHSGPYVTCHADLHANNILIDHAGRVFVIDWDDVMLAPKERDFIFIEDAVVGGPAPREMPPFFQGYGETEIDWAALTYYRCERVVTDLMAWAQDVVLRDDVGEESQAEAVRCFDAQFVEGGMLAAALAAASHLPSGLGLRDQPDFR